MKLPIVMTTLLITFCVCACDQEPTPAWDLFGVYESPDGIQLSLSADDGGAPSDASYDVDHPGSYGRAEAETLVQGWLRFPGEGELAAEVWKVSGTMFESSLEHAVFDANAPVGVLECKVVGGSVRPMFECELWSSEPDPQLLNLFPTDSPAEETEL